MLLNEQNIHKRAKGNIGENIACKFLEGKGFIIKNRNYQRKWGELDIVAEKDQEIHFFEVKSITKNFEDLYFDAHKAEDNVDGLKIKHLRRMIETYLNDEKKGIDSVFHFHVLCVFMNMESRKGRVRWLKDIIL